LLISGCRDGKLERPTSDELAGLEPDTQLLLTPHGDPTSLLGRVVEQDQSGVWSWRTPARRVVISR
jgi:hypothetical protein